ncbi:MAG: hypothetical protein IJD13_00565 [Oscillospiraceae bacterium]|nr:hypothetical protein [Oscillospiraceae bacterium]
MADNNITYGGAAGAGCFKEAVSINAGRVYDSCSSKDCLEDLRVYFTETGQTVISEAQNVKVRRVEVLNVVMDVESVPFNQGFCSVDLTFYFLITLDVYAAGGTTAAPAVVQGLAAFSKKVILYGSEGSVRSFRSDTAAPVSESTLPADTPTARVQTVDPISLSVLLTATPNPDDNASLIPTTIAGIFDGDLVTGEAAQYVYVSIGLFSIVSLERDIQMMVPVYDYSVPEKECVSAVAADPCELFRRIRFPVNEFFPPRMAELHDDE